MHSRDLYTEALENLANQNYAAAAENSETLAKAGDIEKSETLFRKILELDPQNIPAHRNLARLLLANRGAGFYKEVKEHFNYVIAHGAADATVNYGLGMVYSEEGDDAKAAEAFREAIKLDPKDAHAYNGLGHVLESLGETAQALQAYKKAFTIDDNFIFAKLGYATLSQNLRGELALDVKSLYEAIIKQGEAMADKSVWHLMVLAEAYFKLEQYPKAENYFKQIIDDKSELAKQCGNLGLGTLFIKRKKFAEADVHIKAALKESPNNSEALLQQAKIYVHFEHWRDAETVLQKVRQMQPHNVDANLQLAEMYYLQKRYLDAKSYIDLAFAKVPQNKNVLGWRKCIIEKLTLLPNLFGSGLSADSGVESKAIENDRNFLPKLPN